MNGSPEPASDSDPIWKWLGGKWALVALCLVLLIVALYVEEDWRGAAEWNQTQAEIAAAGESLDPKKFIPPPVPDDQNFAALPIFEVTPGWESEAVGMKRTLARLNPYGIPDSAEYNYYERDRLPFVGNWRKGLEPDLLSFPKEMADLCASKGIKTPTGATPLDQFELLCPALPDLRAADKTHPLCQSNFFYNIQPAEAMPMAGPASCLLLTRVLAYEERLALLEHRPDLAFANLKISMKFDAGLRETALLLPGLYAVICQTLQLEVIAQGLSQHVWNQQQLTELDGDLGSIDDLAAARLGVRGNVAIVAIPSVDYLKRYRSTIPDLMFGFPGSGLPRPPATTEVIITAIALLLPNGWMDDWKSQDARLNLLGVVKIVNPERHRAYPEQQTKAMGMAARSTSINLWNNIVLRDRSSGLDQMEHFAYAQVQIDEARIACRLERFRLDHGHYPASLVELNPSYGTDLPHDVMNGDPYHYKVLPDGTYLLYSVGWDQVDDGGKEGPGEYHSYSSDPDWLWRNHPQAKKSK